MSLEIYYPQDILNALLAAEQATKAALSPNLEEVVSIRSGAADYWYWKGYRAALVTLALAFGLVPLRSEDPTCLASIGSIISGQRV